MIARLVLDKDYILPGDICVERFPVVFGRSREADVWLDDRWVSRRHCEIVLDGARLCVRDLGSTYGTLVNGRHVDTCPLEEGDRLSVGLSTFLVQYANASSDRQAEKLMIVAGQPADATRSFEAMVSTSA